MSGFKSLINNEENRLKKDVMIMLSDEIEENELEFRMKEVLDHGSDSGLVSNLSYSNDRVAFFEDHKLEINELLIKTLLDCSFSSPFELFGEKFDNEDPQILKETNQNLLVSFSIDEITKELYRDLYERY